MNKHLLPSDLKLSSQRIFSLAKIYIPSCLFIFSIWLSSKITNVSVYELVADPNEVGQITPYAGIVSNIGILFFCCAASICLFSSCLVDASSRSGKKWRSFLLASGFLVLLLLLDDAFQIHENFSTLLFGAEADIASINKKLQNLLEISVFSVYSLLFISYIFYFRKLIYHTDILVLILTFSFFGMSIAIDLLPETLTGHYILEEGFKFLGIVSLMTYYIRVCYQQVKQKQ